MLTRESEMTGDPERGDQLPVPDRRALREAPRRRAARGRALSRDPPAQPDHEPTLRALEGLKDGDKDPLGAAACSSRSTRRPATGRSSFASTRCRSAARRTRSRRWSSCTASRASTRTRSAITPRRSTPTRARCRSTTATSRRSATSSASRWRSTAGRRSRKLYDAQLDKLAEATNAERFVELGLRNAQIFEVQLEDVDARHRALPPRRSTPTPENLTAIRALDRLYAQTERWAELASHPRARGGDRPVARRDPRAQVPPRSGGADAASATSTRRSPRTATSSTRRPSTRRRSRRSRPSSRAARSSSRSARSSSRSTARSSEWEKLAQRLRGAARAHAGPGGPPGGVLPARRALRGEAARSGEHARRVHPRAQGVSRSTRRRARKSRASPAAVDGGWETLANAYADVLGAHTDPAVQRSIGKPARADVRGRARRHRQGRGDVQVRPQRRRRSTPRRSPTSIASTSRSSRGRSSRRSSRCASRRPTDDARARRALRPPRRALRDAPRRPRRTPSARTAASSTSSTRPTRAPSPPSRASTSSRERGRSSTPSTSASSRTRRATRRRRRSARRSRTSPPTSSASRSAPSRRGRRVLDLRGEDPEALARAREPLRGARAVGASSSTSSSASSTSRRPTRTASNILTRRARIDERQARSRRRGARGLEPRPRHRLREPRGAPRDRRHPAPPGRPERARHRAPPARRPRGVAARGRGAQGDLPRARQDLRRPAPAAVRRRRRVAEAARGRPRLRGDGRARGHLPRRGEVDRRHRRQDAARRGARGAGEQIEELRSVAALWREQVGEPDGARAAYEKILEIDPTHDEAFAELEKLHTAAGRWEPLVELYLARLETREETQREDGAPAQDRARLRGEARRQEPGARRARQRARRWTSTTARRLATSSGWPRPRAAGPRSSRRSTAGSSSRPSRKQKIRLCLHLAKWYGDDLGHPEYAQPYYAQIVQLDPHNVGRACASWRASTRRAATGSRWARR